MSWTQTTAWQSKNINFGIQPIRKRKIYFDSFLTSSPPKRRSHHLGSGSGRKWDDGMLNWLKSLLRRSDCAGVMTSGYFSWMGCQCQMGVSLFEYHQELKVFRDQRCGGHSQGIQPLPDPLALSPVLRGWVGLWVRTDWSPRGFWAWGHAGRVGHGYHRSGHGT